MYEVWYIVIFFCLYITLSPMSRAEDIGLTDKEIIERLVRLEEGQASLNKRFEEGFASLNKRIDDSNVNLNKRIDELNVSLNKRIDELNVSLNKKIDELREFMLWGFGITFAGIFSLVGFVIWDRRSTISPVITSVREERSVVEEVKRREKVVEEVLTEYSKDDPSLAALLKKKGIL